MSGQIRIQQGEKYQHARIEKRKRDTTDGSKPNRIEDGED